ncbi:hypothetical protein [Massilia sp. UBA6681]|uniref:hypothetical protein n=1 Tax=Massilia sp. UBA6681 TaxID=1946839 RepID=UPI0025BBF363|nr:hypothetical protein [Massilia sp. UBA6681]
MIKTAHEMVSPKSASVKAEFELLKEIVRSPHSVDEKLREAVVPALATQGALAAFEYAERGIVSMSLNTHKAIANTVVEGGYQVVNDCRKAALEKLKEHQEVGSRITRGTIDWYKKELAMKNRQLDRIVDDIAFMSTRLDEVMALAQEMAIAAGKLDEFMKRHGQLLRKFR